jgi:glycine C-acetyltransferase
MYGKEQEDLRSTLDEIREAGLFKVERVITSPQGADITVKDDKEVINFCANNYLGLSSHPSVVEAAHKALDEWGYGMSSVRFICGTQDIHKQLEKKISDFLQTEDTILFAACFDANGGIFEPLLGPDDAIITDELNHASIIDGIRLCKASRMIYKHADMEDLEYLADRYEAMVMVDDAHATGFLGDTGRGSIEHCGVMGRVDVITGTFGKALGGASGGFATGRKEIIDLYRQRSRPYLFSNTLAPPIVGATIAVIDLISESSELRDRLMANTRYFREKMTKAGFDITPGVHPIVPILFGKFENDARLSQDFARDLLDDGIYVIGFFYPVVRKGQARIRVQLSAAHTMEHCDRAIEAFTRVGKKYRVIS